MKQAMKWEGSTESKEGVALYSINGVICRVPFSTFEEAFKLNALMDRIYNQGKEDALDRLSRLTEEAIETVRHQ